MNVPLMRLAPGLRVSALQGSRIVQRSIAVSSVALANKKPLMPVRFKEKPKAPIFKVWNGITVKELSEVTQRSLDDVFEAILHIPNADQYGAESDSIDRTDCFKILKLLGYRGEVVPPPMLQEEQRRQKLKNAVEDAVPQPPAKPELLRPRRPVVAVMGHVDHGKTTLLDTLRSSNIVDNEFGGITQHIGAFTVAVPQCAHGAITFLDTPGHAAFSAMRARGANVTDMVVLVVAADDGVMEQTVESIRFANQSNVPIVVAVNKMDKPQANFEKVKQGLLAHGIQSDVDGGDVQFIAVSALKGEGLDKLLEAIILQGELLELKATFQGLSEGHIIESSADQHRGKLATVLVRRGTLRKGSFIVAGTAWCKVRTLFNEWGQPLQEVEPGCAAQVTGWKTLPNAGDLVLEVDNEKRAKDVVELRTKNEELLKTAEEAEAISEKMASERAVYRKRLEEKWSAGFKYRPLDRKSVKFVREDTHPTLRIIVKGDTDGSVEALMDIIDTYDAHEECRLDVVHYGVGPVSKNDLELAETFNGAVYAMHVGMLPEAKSMAEKSRCKEFKVIYHLVHDLRKELSQRLPPVDAEEVLGEASVLQEFMVTDERIKKKVPVAGCRCIKGVLDRDAHFKLIRDDKEIFSGRLASMKHLKNEVNTVKKDVECGLMLDNASVKPEPGDKIVCVRRFKQSRPTSWEPYGFENQ